MTVLLQTTLKVLEAVSIIALQLSRESKTGFIESTTMLAKLVQPKNAFPLMSITDLGMNMLVKPGANGILPL